MPTKTEVASAFALNNFTSKRLLLGISIGDDTMNNDPIIIEVPTRTDGNVTRFIHFGILGNENPLIELIARLNIKVNTATI